MAHSQVPITKTSRLLTILRQHLAMEWFDFKFLSFQFYLA